MRPIATHVTRSVVFVLVRYSPAKTEEPVEIPFTVDSRGMMLQIPTSERFNVFGVHPSPLLTLAPNQVFWILPCVSRIPTRFALLVKNE